jgi:16S rRNA processing protein RimM
MAYIANILLGRISKAHGFEGAVTVKLEKSFIDEIDDMESVFLEIEGKPVPFFVEESEYPGGNILRLKFTGFNNVDCVNEFAGCKVFLTSALEENPDIKVNFSIEGYKICLPDNAVLGIVKKVMENPGQWLLEITSSDGKELLIPYHEDLILGIDHRKKIITMKLPEGLIDLN